MSAPDNLEAIWAAPFGDVLDDLEALMAQDGRVFLIGAGCSKCAGLPLMEEFTAKESRTASLARMVQILGTTLVKLSIFWPLLREGLNETQLITSVFIKDKQYSGQQLRACS